MTRQSFNRHPPSEAFAWADRLVRIRAVERVPLAHAHGRKLAGTLPAVTDEPRARRAAVDGWAVAAAQTQGASDYSPLHLRAGSDGTADASPILAGEALPPRADAVLPRELADLLGGFVEVSTSVAVGDGVIATAAEFQSGRPLLEADRALRPQDLAFAGLAGYAELEVRARPRVALALAGEPEHDAAGPMLAALVARDGGELTGVTHAVGPTALRAFLQDTAADLLLLVGGSGFGRNDAAVSTLGSCGEIHLDGIAMHPGETLVLGEVHGTPVGVLPGTPLATLFAYDAVIGRAVRRLAGADGDWPYRRCGLILTRKVASILGRMEFCRVRVAGETAEPVAIAEGHVLRTAVRADGFIVIAEELEGYAEGTLVEVLLYGGTR